VRGILPAGSSVTALYRNTPASAGNTLDRIRKGLNIKKHPRECGEYTALSYGSYVLPETPPRVRGILYVVPATHELDGNTPASAGNTSQHGWGCRFLKKHPRECGEYFESFARGCLQRETPPRVRGIRLEQEGVMQTTRNTPASAGNTRNVHFLKGVLEKHPRECGEYRIFMSIR